MPSATTSATSNPARVPLPKSFKEDNEHYDSNLVFKAILKKNVEPTAWSRTKAIAGMDIRDITINHLSRRGLDEFGLRGLSHGRFTGLFLIRNVAETVLLSQLQKKLHEDNIDVDATIDALYKSKSMKSPDKVKEAATCVAHLVDEFLQSIKPWAQVKNYAIKNYEHDNQATQRIQELEEEVTKHKKRLRSAGI